MAAMWLRPIYLEPVDHGVLTLMTLSIARTVARGEFGNLFFCRLFYHVRTQMFSLFRTRVFVTSLFYFYHVRTLEGVTVIRPDEGSCLPPKYWCCCLKFVFSVLFKYEFTEKVF